MVQGVVEAEGLGVKGSWDGLSMSHKEARNSISRILAFCCGSGWIGFSRFKSFGRGSDWDLVLSRFLINVR